MHAAKPTRPARRRPTRSPASPTPAAAEPLEARRLLSGTTYYVSNAGSDQNPGTSAAQPWQTVAKVDASTFQPGDTILFDRGNQWREALSAPDSGTAGAPITFGAYGDASAPLPLFTGSDLIDPATFTPVSGTTYSVADGTAADWVYVDGAFTREAQDVLTQSGNATPADPATDLTYVEANAGTFYFNPTTTTLYVNDGGPLTGHTVEVTDRDYAVNNNGQSWVTFDSLAASETAQDNGGYGFRVQGGTNDTVTNCSSTEAGKHNFGIINTTAFTGINLTSTLEAPDAGFGGASAIAYFVDAGSGVTNATAQFTNCTYVDGSEPYPIFISHGEGTDPIASIALTNLVSTDGYGDGILVYTTGPKEVTTVTGGHIAGGVIEVDTDHSVVSGVDVTGAFADVTLGGTGDYVQNCLFTGINPNAEIGHPGAVTDNGSGNVVRFNTFSWTGFGGAAIDDSVATANTDVEGNIFDCPEVVLLNYDAGTPALTSDRNLLLPSATFVFGAADPQGLTLAQWQGAGFDAHSVAAPAQFNAAAGGDYTLFGTSPAIDLYTAVPSQSPVPITTDFNGDPRPYGGGYDAGAFERQSPLIPIVGTLSVANATLPPVSANTTTDATFTVTLSAPQAAATTVQYATADGTAAAGKDYTAAIGTVTFAPGQTTELVRVAVTPTVDDVGTTFTLHLTDPTVGIALGVPVATATIPAAPTRSTAADKTHPQLVTDGSAQPVVVRVAGPGDAVILQTGVGNGIVELYVFNTTLASTVTVQTEATERTTIGTIELASPLGRLVAPTTALTGDLTALADVRGITLDDLTGPADVRLRGTKVATTLSFGAVSDASLTAAAPIAALSAATWSATDLGTVTAPSIGALRVPGSFGPDLTLTATGPNDLSTAVLGNVTGGTWTAAGGVGSVAARSTAAAWTAALGSVRSLATTGNASGVLTAASIDSWRVGGDLSGATVTLTGPAGKGYDLSSLTVAGTVTGSTVRSAGSVNAVTVGAMSASTLYLGVTPAVTGLPTAAADFTSTTDRLNAFTVTGARGTTAGLTGSNVAAAAVGHVRVTGLHTANAGTPFGFAAESLALYTDLEPGKKPVVWTPHAGTATLPADGDFKVSLV